MDEALITEARERAEAVLLSNGGELGLLGASSAYQQVWARDSMICGLGLMLTEEGAAIHGRSLGGGVAAQIAARRKPAALISGTCSTPICGATE